MKPPKQKDYLLSVLFGAKNFSNARVSSFSRNLGGLYVYIILNLPSKIYESDVFLGDQTDRGGPSKKHQHLVWGEQHFIFSLPCFSCLKMYLPHLFVAGDGFSRASPGREDPANPKVLTLNQFNKAITVRFQHTKSFHLSFWAHLKSLIVFSVRCWRSFPNKETNGQRNKQRRY